MRFDRTSLVDVWVIAPDPHTDERGFFARTFCRDEFERHGLIGAFAQDSIAFNARSGTVRGLHFSRPPHGETKLIRCLRGAIFDVVVDLRPHSATYLQTYSRILNDVNRESMYVGDGLAHGYQTLTNDAEVSYRIDVPFVEGSSAGVRYDDPALGIAWPLPMSVLSERDRDLPGLTGVIQA